MRPGAIEIASRVLGVCACRRVLSRIFQAAISMLIAREAFFGVYRGRIVCSRGLRVPGKYVAFSKVLLCRNVYAVICKYRIIFYEKIAFF